jgi:hypothetical protein
MHRTPPARDISRSKLFNRDTAVTTLRIFGTTVQLNGSAEYKLLLLSPTANFRHDHEDRRPCFPLDKRCRVCAGTEGRHSAFGYDMLCSLKSSFKWRDTIFLLVVYLE